MASAAFASGDEFRLDIAIDAHHCMLAALDRLDPARIGFDQLPFQIAGLDRGHRAAHRFDLPQFFLRRLFEFVDLGGDHRRAVEQIAIFQQVGLIGEDLLHAQRPLLIPRPRQTERLVPGRQLHRARPRFFGQRHRQHLDQDARDIVLGLLLGQAERVHLHAVTEQPLLRIGDAVAFTRDLVPQLGEGAHLADFGDEAQPGIDEERDAPDHFAEFFRRAFARGLHRVEHADGGGERKAKLLHRRGACFLQVIGADIHRVPLRHFLGREQNHVLGQPHRGRRRKHIGAAREILLDDVVLRRAGEFLPRDALLIGQRHIKRQQPGGRGVDGHRRVHLAERNAVEQGAHVADVRDRHADLADFALGVRMIAVVAGLRRQIEGDRQPGLTLA